MNSLFKLFCLLLMIDGCKAMEPAKKSTMYKDVPCDPLKEDPILSTLGDYSFKRIEGGLGGARLYRLQSGDENFVVRIQDKGIFSTDNLYEDSKIASDAGYGPYLHFVDAEKGLMMMEEVRNDWSLPRTGSLFHEKLASTIQTMHQGPLFYQQKNFLEWIQDSEEKLKSKGVCFPILNEDDKTLYKETLDNALFLMPLFEDDIRPCHHDIHPGNILYDADKLVLIDFESASNDVLFFDLGIAVNYHIHEENNVFNFLTSYFNGHPTPEQIAKFTCLRPLGAIFHSFWLADIAGLSSILEHKEIPLYKHILPLMRQGNMDMSSKKVQQAVAISTFNEAMRLIKEESYTQSINYLRKKL